MAVLAMGTHSDVKLWIRFVKPLNPSGATPTTSNGSPPMWMLLPTMAGLDWKRVRQNRWLSTTTRDGVVSSAG
jgi:hypothetical protein